MLFVVTLATGLRLISLGGGIYEMALVDPVWPARPDMIRPTEGGIARARFWIPMHLAFEIALVSALLVAWTVAQVRTWLLVAFISHLIMRLWSAVSFIPQALRFERGDSRLRRADADRWVRFSRMRLPLDLVCAVSMLLALIAVARA